MKSERTILKVISLILVFGFFLQELAFATPDLKPGTFQIFQQPAVNFRFPQSVASIDDIYKGAEGKTVILIQDAHTNESAQLNVAKALDLIFEKEKIKYVFLEAGTKDASLTFLKDKTSLERRKEVGLSYLKRGELKGTEYFNLTSDHDFVLWGVEDETLYQKALFSYKAVAERREKYHEYLKKVGVTIETLKPRVFNPSLLSFDKQREAYLKEKISLIDYLEILTQEAHKRNIPLSAYPHLKTLKAIRQKEKDIDFRKANEEQIRAIASLNKEDLEALTEASKEANFSPFKVSSREHKEQKALYVLLEEKVKNLPDYPELSKYIEYLKEARKVEAKGVLDEYKSLETRVYASLIRSEDEQKLHEASKNLRSLVSLLNLQLTPDEFEEYKANPKAFDIVHLTGFLNKKIMDLKDHYERAVFLEGGYEEAAKSAEEFYSLTYERDRAFVRNMLQKMDEEKEGKAILVMGGYHTPNVKALLKKANISYVVVSPQILRETNQKRYEKILFSRAGIGIDEKKAANITKDSNANDTIAERVITQVSLPWRQLQQGVLGDDYEKENKAYHESVSRLLSAKSAAGIATVTQTNLDRLRSAPEGARMAERSLSRWFFGDSLQDILSNIHRDKSLATARNLKKVLKQIGRANDMDRYPLEQAVKEFAKQNPAAFTEANLATAISLFSSPYTNVVNAGFDVIEVFAKVQPSAFTPANLNRTIRPMWRARTDNWFDALAVRIKTIDLFTKINPASFNSPNFRNAMKLLSHPVPIFVRSGLVIVARFIRSNPSLADQRSLAQVAALLKHESDFVRRDALNTLPYFAAADRPFGQFECLSGLGTLLAFAIHSGGLDAGALTKESIKKAIQEDLDNERLAQLSGLRPVGAKIYLPVWVLAKQKNKLEPFGIVWNPHEDSFLFPVAYSYKTQIKILNQTARMRLLEKTMAETDFERIYPGHENYVALWEDLVQRGYLDASGVIQPGFIKLQGAADLILNQAFVDKKEEIYSHIRARLLSTYKYSLTIQGRLDDRIKYPVLGEIAARDVSVADWDEYRVGLGTSGRLVGPVTHGGGNLKPVGEEGLGLNDRTDIGIHFSASLADLARYAQPSIRNLQILATALYKRTHPQGQAPSEIAAIEEDYESSLKALFYRRDLQDVLNVEWIRRKPNPYYGNQYDERFEGERGDIIASLNRLEEKKTDTVLGEKVVSAWADQVAEFQGETVTYLEDALIAGGIHAAVSGAKIQIPDLARLLANHVRPLPLDLIEVFLGDIFRRLPVGTLNQQQATQLTDGLLSFGHLSFLAPQRKAWIDALAGARMAEKPYVDLMGNVQPVETVLADARVLRYFDISPSRTTTRTLETLISLLKATKALDVDAPDILLIGGTVEEVEGIAHYFPKGKITAANIDKDALISIADKFKDRPDVLERLKLYRADASQLNREIFPDASFDFIYAGGLNETAFRGIDARKVLPKMAEEEVRLLREGGVLSHWMLSPLVYYGVFIHNRILQPIIPDSSALLKKTIQKNPVGARMAGKFESINRGMKRIKSVVQASRAEDPNRPILILLDGIGGKTTLARAINADSKNPDHYELKYKNLGLKDLKQNVLVVEADSLHKLFEQMAQNPDTHQSSPTFIMPYQVLREDVSWFKQTPEIDRHYGAYLARYFKNLFTAMANDSNRGLSDRIVVFDEASSHLYFNHALRYETVSEGQGLGNILVVGVAIKKSKNGKRRMSVGIFTWPIKRAPNGARLASKALELQNGTKKSSILFSPKGDFPSEGPFRSPRFYDDALKGLDMKPYSDYETPFANLLADVVKRSSHPVWVDVAFGYGFALRQAKQKYPQLSTYGVEIEDWWGWLKQQKPEEATQYVAALGEELFHETNGFQLIKQSAENVSLSERADIISMFYGLQYAEDPIQVIVNLYNQLKPGGFLVLNYLFPSFFRLASNESEFGNIIEKITDELKANGIEVFSSPHIPNLPIAFIIRRPDERFLTIRLAHRRSDREADSGLVSTAVYESTMKSGEPWIQLGARMAAQDTPSDQEIRGFKDQWDIMQKYPDEFIKTHWKDLENIKPIQGMFFEGFLTTLERRFEESMLKTQWVMDHWDKFIPSFILLAKAQNRYQFHETLFKLFPDLSLFEAADSGEIQWNEITRGVQTIMDDDFSAYETNVFLSEISYRCEHRWLEVDYLKYELEKMQPYLKTENVLLRYRALKLYKRIELQINALQEAHMKKIRALEAKKNEIKSKLLGSSLLDQGNPKKQIRRIVEAYAAKSKIQYKPSQDTVLKDMRDAISRYDLDEERIALGSLVEDFFFSDQANIKSTWLDDTDLLDQIIQIIILKAADEDGERSRQYLEKMAFEISVVRSWENDRVNNSWGKKFNRSDKINVEALIDVRHLAHQILHSGAPIIMLVKKTEVGGIKDNLIMAVDGGVGFQISIDEAVRRGVTTIPGRAPDRSKEGQGLAYMIREVNKLGGIMIIESNGKRAVYPAKKRDPDLDKKIFLPNASKFGTRFILSPRLGYELSPDFIHLLYSEDARASVAVPGARLADIKTSKREAVTQLLPDVRQATVFPEPLENFFAQTALAHEGALAREGSLPEYIAVSLEDNAPASIFGLRLKEDGNRFMLEVTQEGKTLLLIRNVKEVIKDSRGKPKAAVIKIQDLILLVRMRDKAIRDLLQSIPDIDHTLPVSLNANLKVFGSLLRDPTYFDLFILQAYKAKREKNEAMRHTFFTLKGTKKELKSAMDRLKELEEKYDLEGKLQSLFTRRTHPEFSQVDLVPSNRRIKRVKNHRYLPLAVAQPGDVLTYQGIMELGSYEGRIKIENSLDPRFHKAYEMASQRRISPRTLKKGIVQGRVRGTSTLRKHATRPLARVDLQDLYQWAKNMLSIASAA